MDIMKLQYFISAIHAGSYRRAAEQLFVTPQTISKAINALENEIAIELTAKGKNGLTLTSFGEIFYTRAVDLVEDFFELVDLAKLENSSTRDFESLTIALSSSPLEGIDIDRSLFEAFENEYAVQLHCLFRPSETCLPALEEELIDAAIVIGRERRPNIKCTRLFSREPLVALSKDHPLAVKERLRFGELNGSRVVRPQDLRYGQKTLTTQLKQQGCSFVFVDVPPYAETLQSFLETEQAIMFVAKNPQLKNIYPHLLFVPLDIPHILQIPFCLIRRKNERRTLLDALERSLLKSIALSAQNDKRTLQP